MDNKKIEFLKKYEKGGNLVLSTCEENIVTSRTISVIVIDDALYFTSVKREGNMKNKQIAANENIALCEGTRQMTGTAHILGLTSEPQFADILKVYKEVLADSHAMFEHEDCLLIKIDIKTVKDFTFKDGKPEVINIAF